jgi:membrane-associated phospholipid phosphatase
MTRAPTWMALIVLIGATGVSVRAAEPQQDDRASSTAPRTAAADEPHGPVNQFLRDTLSDYRNVFSWQNAAWLGVGGAAALVAHGVDEDVHGEVLEAGTTTLPGAYLYGAARFQVPFAVVWWIAGHAAGSDLASATGRDLLRAQISAISWTAAIQWATERTRPNGDPRSLPSGHTSAAFATAAVLYGHYGWKLGVPALAAAAYTGTSRITVDAHWLSDVMFGAVLGAVCGRTVTVRLREYRVVVVPRGAVVIVQISRAS